MPTANEPSRGWALLLFAWAHLLHAQQPTELNDDFLEYLGNMESSEENWTDFAARPAAAPATAAAKSSAQNSSAKSAASSSTKSTESARNPAPANSAGRKASK